MAQQPKKLVIGVGQEPTSMDPSLAYTGGDYPIVENYGEFLIYRAPNGDLKPGLATSWKMSPDGKVIEFTLRKGVKFHSGDPLTVKDVVFSYERGRTKNSTVRTRLRSMEKIEVVDDYHFNIHLKVPDVAFFPYRGCVFILSKSYYDRVGEDRFVRQPVGTGPYKFVNHVPGEYVDIERFEDYWGEKTSVKEARFLFIPEEATKIAKLKAGELDIATGCPYPSVKDLEKSSGLKVVKLSVDHSTLSIMFSTRNPNTPWHDRRVRLAMAYAIDCDSIIKNVLYDIPHRYAYFAPYEVGYDPDLKPYPYDPKKARQLLAESGYPNGFEFNLYWPITGRNPMVREVVEAIAGYLQEINIQAKLVGEEFSKSYTRHTSSKGPEARYVCYRGAGRAGSVEATQTMELFFGSDGGFSVYSNPELDMVIAEARTTVDATKRGAVLRKAARLISDDVATIPIFNTVSVYAMKKNIDFKPTQNQPMELIHVKDVTIN
jgi:peptide/nickel transport system substrate-binding protein